MHGREAPQGRKASRERGRRSAPARADWLRFSIGLAAILVLGAVIYGGLRYAEVPNWAYPVVLAILVACPVLLFLLLDRGRTAGRASMEQATETSELIRRSYDAVGAPRAVIGPGGETIFANAAFLDLFRRPDGDSGMDAIQTSLVGDSKGLAEFGRLCRAAATGVAGRADFFLRRDNGQREWRHIQAVPIEGATGHFVLRIEDVTAQKDLAAILRQEQKKLSDFLEYAPLGFFSADEAGRFVYMNVALSEMLGVTRADLATDAVRLHRFLEEPPGEGAAPFDPFGNGGEGRAVTVLRAKDGRSFEAELVQRVESYGEGVIRTRSIVRDLSAERQWQQALEEAEEQGERLFDDAPIGVAMIDFEGWLLRCNRVMRAMTGIGDQEGTSGRLQEFLHSEDVDGLDRAIEALGADGPPPPPVDVRPAGRPDRILSVYLSRIEGAAGGAPAVVAHALDTTEQHNLERQFAQSQKMQAIGQLAGGIAHDFNNLLTAMIGYCDLMLMRHKPGEQSFADIMQIKQNANRATDLVRQLLAFSRQQTLKPKVLRITDVLMEIVHLLRRLVGSNVQLKLVHGRDLGLIKVDQGQLEQVIINLVVNARDAMPEGGEIEIRTGNLTVETPTKYGAENVPAGNYLSIEVLDEGTGIVPEHMERIFEPFFSTKEVGAGTGLGLSTVYGIVKQTGGYVFVDSEVGRGARFTLLFPCHVAVERTAAPASMPASRPLPRDLTGAGTILLVEDEEAVRLFSARALRNKGYKVIEARSGQGALEQMEQTGDKIDLLITDIVMPEMDGATLIRLVRERWPDLRIVCVSGYAEETFREKIDFEDSIAFLPKPFNLDQLAGAVKDALADRQEFS